jgi:hypothetical protein
MATADRFRRAANAGRRAAVSVGQRPTTVSITVRTYSSDVNVLGATLSMSTVSTILPAPKVAPAGDGPFSWYGGGNGTDAGGVARAGLYLVGPITPSFPGGGYDESDLAPAGAANKRITVTLAGGDFPASGEVCSVLAIHRETPQSIHLLVQRTKP